MMAHPQSFADWPEHLEFLGRFLRSPRTIGSFAPSSRWLAKAMVVPFAGPADQRPSVRIVELGPGTGAFTREIRERLGPADRFLSVEVEPAFAEGLRRRWPDIECVCASAESLPALASERQLGPIDHIVSGLPFATLPPETTRRILEAVGKTLRPGGTFTTFQYVPAYGFRPAIAFRRQMNELMASAPSLRLVARNLPPAFALSWTNRRAGVARSR